MEYECPLCNGLKNIEVHCPECHRLMADMGRIHDYYDDYSPYEPIEEIKLADGFPDNTKTHQCPHLFICVECDTKEVRLISEWSEEEALRKE
ncbi:hypothetical protein [Pseudalkalibacillus caeni]|uniref:Uncharacterized protein n=1 Tax=Exobacillus caeni TaxID=2574798 RepID=A0A5R9FBU5_9BACL|nr:hypothetical protein [Pseudalkalibacillus caeni]TLS38024.1 hypothetical protein FCL54_05615 [Pseudalkalibacillus caeni]